MCFSNKNKGKTASTLKAQENKSHGILGPIPNFFLNFTKCFMDAHTKSSTGLW